MRRLVFVILASSLLVVHVLLLNHVMFGVVAGTEVEAVGGKASSIVKENYDFLDASNEVDMFQDSECHSSEMALVSSSSLEIGGNETYTLANGVFILNETFVLKENATLIIENAEVKFNETSSTIIEANDNSTVIINNSTAYRISGGACAYSYTYFYDLTSSSIEKSFLWRVYRYLYDNSTSIVNYSTFTYDTYCYGYSKLLVEDSRVNYIRAYSYSSISVFNSTVNCLYVYDFASAFVRDSRIPYRIDIEFDQDSNLSVFLPRGYVSQWNLYADNFVTKSYVNLTLEETRVYYWRVYIRDTSVVSVHNSKIDTIYVYGNSRLSLYDSVVNSIYAYGDSTISLCDSMVNTVGAYDYSNTSIVTSMVSSTIYLDFEYDSNLTLSLPTGHVTYWNLFTNNSVVKAYGNMTLQDSFVNAWGFNVYRSTISLVDSKKVDYISGYDNSTILVFDSIITGLYGYDFSVVTITSSTLNYLYLYDWSTASAEDSIFWNVYAYTNSSISLDFSRTGYLGVYDYATVSIEDSAVSYRVEMSFVSDSDVSLNSLPVGFIGYWNLYDNATIGKAYINLTMRDTLIRGWSYIYAYDFTKLSVSNSIIDGVYPYDFSQTSISNSIIGTVYSQSYSQINLSNSLVDYFYACDYSNASITDSEITYELSFYFVDDSNLSLTSLLPGKVEYWNLYANWTVVKAYVNHTISNTWIGGWSIYMFGSSAISVMDSTLLYMYYYGSSVGVLTDSILSGVYTYDLSKISVMNSIVDYVGGYSQSTVSLIESTVKYDASCYDYSKWTITDSRILSRLFLEFEEISEVLDISTPIGLVSYWSLYENTTVIRVYIDVFLLNTTVNAWRFYIRGFSTISLRDSMIDTINTYNSSNTLISNCTVEYIKMYGDSRVSVGNSSPGKSHVGYLYTYDTSTAIIIKSVAGIIYADEDSFVELAGSAYGFIRVYNDALVIVSWFLEVHVVDQIGQNVPSADVIVYYGYVGGTVVDSKLTNSDGITHFVLTEKMKNVTGEYPHGNYAVKATYGSYSNSTTVEMTENKQVTIVLHDFIIPEFLSLVIPLLLMAATLLAVIFYRKKFTATARKFNR